jgi:hypothetical protein
MLPCMFGGTTDWRQELLGCAPVCDPRTKEHAQPCPFRKFHPERGTSAMSENRGIMLCDDARPPVRARDIRLRSVQVAAPASSRESVSAAISLILHCGGHCLGVDCAVAIGPCWSGWFDCVPWKFAWKVPDLARSPRETASATAAITIGCGPARPASALSHKQT